jgi:CDP-diacylglycerol--glycerol-3-phosphate 3-phosphatidyltransferase
MRVTDRWLWPWLIRPLYRLGITPNQVSMARLVLTFSVLARGALRLEWWAFAAFAVAALTDAVDGGLARTTGQITDFGKILDPVIDKLLIATAIVAFCLTGEDTLVRWMCVIAILAAEGVLGVLRPLLRRSNASIDLSARWWGKVKMITQSALVAIILMPLLSTTTDTILLAVIAVVTVLSSAANITYFVGVWRRARER